MKYENFYRFPKEIALRGHYRHEKSTPAEGRTNKLQTDKGMYGD